MEVLKYSIKLYREEIGRKYPTAGVWFSTPEGEELVTAPLGFEKFPETTEEWLQLVKDTVDDVLDLYKEHKNDRTDETV